MAKQENWIWMPHAGHLIVGNKCQFHLNTYVGGYIVSTVGEYWPERSSREIHAEVYDLDWLNKNRHLKGDNFDYAYMKRFGYEAIGADRTFETIVFRARRETNPEEMCCLWTIDVGKQVDFDGYNDRVEAYKGHLQLCKKWATKPKEGMTRILKAEAEEALELKLGQNYVELADGYTIFVPEMVEAVLAAHNKSVAEELEKLKMYEVYRGISADYPRYCIPSDKINSRIEQLKGAEN